MALRNSKHERFAQNLHAGMSQTDAYEDAGFKRHRPNASKLAHAEHIVERVAELNSTREYMEREATKKAIDALAISKEAILGELAKIGFADIRQAVEWRGSLVREELRDGEGESETVVKEIVTNHVRLIDSDKLDANIAAAIFEVRQSPTGGLSIKFHDKQAALVALGKAAGLFVDRVADVTADYAISDKPMSPEEWRQQYAKPH